MSVEDNDWKAKLRTEAFFGFPSVMMRIKLSFHQSAIKVLKLTTCLIPKTFWTQKKVFTPMI